MEINRRESWRWIHANYFFKTHLGSDEIIILETDSAVQEPGDINCKSEMLHTTDMEFWVTLFPVFHPVFRGGDGSKMYMWEVYQKQNAGKCRRACLFTESMFCAQVYIPTKVSVYSSLICGRLVKKARFFLLLLCMICCRQMRIFFSFFFSSRYQCVILVLINLLLRAHSWRALRISIIQSSICWKGCMRNFLKLGNWSI